MMLIAMLGIRGAGKTTLTHRLSDLTGWPFLSTDETVKKIAGKSIPEIVAEQGWNGFRALEQAALRQCIAEADVICPPGKGVFLDTGGGIVLQEENRQLLQTHCQMVYLQSTPEVLVARCGDFEDRPPLTDAKDAVKEMRKVLAERDPYYHELAHLEIDTAQLGLEASVTIVMNWVSARCGVCEF